MVKILAFILLVIYPTLPYSEPSSVVKYLMNDKPSMLDWGMYKLKQDLLSTDIFPTIPGYESSVYVDYDWSKNKLIISIILDKVYKSNKPNLTYKQAKAVCRDMIETIKRDVFFMGFVDRLRVGHRVSDYFHHSGFTNKNEPKDFDQKIEEITYFTITFIDESDLTCTSSLTEKTIQYNK